MSDTDALPGAEVVETSAGPARVTLDLPRRPRLLAVLGHGAGGGVDAPDLLALRAALHAAGAAVARIEQPYRVAGRRAPAPAPRLDSAWTETVAAVRASYAALATVPLVAGGRSSGARVACRTAHAVGAAAVVALAFPLHPPGRPERSRLPELLAVEVPVLVVQGERDAFGAPGEFPAGVNLLPVPGADHALRREPAVTAGRVVEWLRERGLL